MSSRRKIGWSIAGAISVLGILFFFQTRDPMVLIFAIVIAGIAVAVSGAGARADAHIQPAGHTHCPSCGASNDTGAKFCSQCGRAF